MCGCHSHLAATVADFLDEDDAGEAVLQVPEVAGRNAALVVQVTVPAWVQASHEHTYTCRA